MIKVKANKYFNIEEIQDYVKNELKKQLDEVLNNRCKKRKTKKKYKKLYRHINQVKNITEKLSDELKLPIKLKKIAMLAALLHDIKKYNKKGKKDEDHNMTAIEYLDSVFFQEAIPYIQDEDKKLILDAVKYHKKVYENRNINREEKEYLDVYKGNYEKVRVVEIVKVADKVSKIYKNIKKKNVKKKIIKLDVEEELKNVAVSLLEDKISLRKLAQ